LADLRDDAGELVGHFRGERLEQRVTARRHRLHLIDDGHVRPPAFLVDRDIAREEQADVEARRERSMREGGVAGAEDRVASKIDVDLLLQRRLDVDLCQRKGFAPAFEVEEG
jgi:hypothetical protein